jgi:hypothetical protein
MDDIHLNQKSKAVRGRVRPFPYPAELAGGYVKAMSERAAFQGIANNAKIISKGITGEKVSDLLVEQGVFSLSSFTPWKATLGSLSRVASTPVDNNTFKGIILSNTPIVGPILGQPALNVLGDPVRDNSLSGKLYREGVPLIISFPKDGPGSRVYDLILEQGRGPSLPQIGALEQQFGTVITKEQFYDYSKERGRIIKEEMNTQFDRLRALDPKQFGKALERITSRANRRAAQAVGFSRAASSR